MHVTRGGCECGGGGSVCIDPPASFQPRDDGVWDRLQGFHGQLAAISEAGVQRSSWNQGHHEGEGTVALIQGDRSVNLPAIDRAAGQRGIESGHRLKLVSNLWSIFPRGGFV